MQYIISILGVRKGLTEQLEQNIKLGVSIAKK